MDFFIKSEAKFKNLENSHLVHIAKNEKACWEENPKGCGQVTL